MTAPRDPDTEALLGEFDYGAEAERRLPSRATRYVFPDPASIPPRVRDPEISRIVADAKAALDMLEDVDAALNAVARAWENIERHGGDLGGEAAREVSVYAVRKGLDPDYVHGAEIDGVNRALDWRAIEQRRAAYQRPQKAAAQEAPIEPLEMFDAGDWEGKPVPPRRWLTQEQIPAGEPGILSGDGGIGKTMIALQLVCSVAAEWPDWLGKLIEAHGPAIFYSVEEKLTEMHRRLARILESRGTSFAKLRKRLFLIGDRKDETVLARADRNGLMVPTRTLLRLEKSVALVKPALLVIENAADVFAGNENDRAQVHPFVRGHIGGLCNINGATGVLLQHPSVSGLVDGSGRTGSTGWNNAGRWRLNFVDAKSRNDNDDDAAQDEGRRELKTVKTNYGRRGEKITLQWKDGVFVPQGMQSLAQLAAADQAERLFLECLDSFAASGRRVSATKTAPTYAPAAFAKTAKGKPVGKKAMEAAMEKLFTAKTIRVGLNPDVKPSKATRVILREDQAQ